MDQNLYQHNIENNCVRQLFVRRHFYRHRHRHHHHLSSPLKCKHKLAVVC